MKNNINRFPWIFWFSIKKREQWFSYWWKTRGSNYIEFQVWKYRITIGLPWIKDVLEGKIRDYKSLKSAKETNDSNLKAPFSFQIGRYKPVS